MNVIITYTGRRIVRSHIVGWDIVADGNVLLLYLVGGATVILAERRKLETREVADARLGALQQLLDDVFSGTATLGPYATIDPGKPLDLQALEQEMQQRGSYLAVDAKPS